MVSAVLESLDYTILFCGGFYILILLSLGIRLWNAWRHQHKWTAFEILSHALSILSALILIVPLALIVYNAVVINSRFAEAMEGIAKECGSLLDSAHCIDCGPGEDAFGVQAIKCNAMDSTRQYYLSWFVKSSVTSLITRRAALWLARCSFVAFFLSFRQVFSRKARFYLYMTAGLVPAAMLAILLLDGLNHLYITNKAFGFEYCSFGNETVASWLSVIVDMLLIVIPYSTVKALNLPRRAMALLVIIVSTSLFLALLRLWFLEAWLSHFAMETEVVYTVTVDMLNRGPALVAFNVVNFSEVYVTVLVANLPGVRALLRSIRKSKPQLMGSTSLEDAKTSIET